MQIADSRGNHCADHGFSVMRLALGYDEGLPKRWPYNIEKTQRKLAQLAAISFPGRDVRVWHAQECWDRHHEDVQYMGDFLADVHVTDDWLFGFAYMPKENADMSHFVVGFPQVYKALTITFVIAVSRIVQ